MYAGLVANILLSGSCFVIVHVEIFCGKLFSPQQSADVVVPGGALNPAGQAVHAAEVAFENVSAAHVIQELAEIAAGSG